MSFTGKKLFQGTPPSALVANPNTAPTLSTNNTGGSLSGSITVYAKYSWVTTMGETQCSPEANVVIPSGTNTNTVTATIPSLPAGVSSANLYLSIATGTETKQGNTTTTSYTQSASLVAGTAQPSANTANLAYTVPASTITILKSLLANNTDSIQHGLTLYIVPSGQSAGTGNQFLSNWKCNIGTQGNQGLNDHIILNAGDSLVFVQEATGMINVIVSGTEVV